MKLKYYLRGIGVGVIVTTLILSIFFHIKYNSLTTADETTTEATSESLFETTTPAQTTEKDTTKAETTKAETTKAETTTAETTTAETTTAETTTAAPETQPATTATPVSSLQITRGMYSEAVSQKLKELGVVDNAAKFNEYLVQNGYAERIMTGTYKVQAGMSYESIAQLITNR